MEYGNKVQGDNSTNLNQNYHLLTSTYEVSGRLLQADSLFRIIIENYRLKKDTLAWLEAGMFYSKVLVKNKQAEKDLKLKEDIIILPQVLKNFKVHSSTHSIYALNLHETGYDKKAFGVMEEMIGLETRNNAEILKSEIAKAEAAFKVHELAREKEQAIIAEQNRSQPLLNGQLAHKNNLI